MGRQGPRLVPFLHDGVINKKYRNLIPEDPSGLKFSIVLPHKTKKLDVEDEFIFKDWYALNKKKYVFHSKHYTDAKQAITASLRKSDYVEKIHISDDRLTYRILSKAEVKEKKRLKKELKKLNVVKKEASDSDGALSSVESGYGSGVDSPQDDYAQVSLNDNLITTPSGNESGYGKGTDSPQNDYSQGSLNDNLITPSGYESSPMFNTMETNSLFGINDVLQMTCSGKFDGFLKPEPMDASISTENSLAVPDTPVLFESDLFTNIQSFADNLKSADYFPENTEHPTHSLDFMDFSSGAPELYSSGFVAPPPFENEKDFLQLDSLSVEDLSNFLFKDVGFNSNSSLVCEDSTNNQASETQNGHEMPTETEDILTEKLCNKLIEDISAIDFHPSVAFEGKSQEQISSSPDAVLPDYETEAGENIYLCKKCVHLGKTPILFCEPQFKKNSTETLGELKIAFEEAVLKEINGFKSVKEHKFINDHLMVILEPNDD
ncbi:hypothetical protein AVEN_216815-1 [Araneus ventricosus]|uniref:IRF tryptophan pentad repeat domain-containing protein n=1 Tax=Araneus ventricosus TaxID=182803 RepID=A0A4Y2MXV3_ARAVE|nr:hypothetical protein AVEN_216815-1 [Araneus ventricosus]